MIRLEKVLIISEGIEIKIRHEATIEIYGDGNAVKVSMRTF